MTERPILFSAPMVRALLAGTKTQTRRAVKPAYVNDNGYSLREVVHGEAARKLTGPNDRAYVGFGHPSSSSLAYFGCPYGQPGDRLWVRETWDADFPVVRYKADRAEIEVGEEHRGALRKKYDTQRGDWWPSIHMPRWASRLTLEVTAVRVERLQDITPTDALAEGISLHPDFHCKPRDSLYGPVRTFVDLWESINGYGSWPANPWVWVVEFRRLP